MPSIILAIPFPCLALWEHYKTLAYALATDEEKELLIELFSVIARKIHLYGDAAKIQKYARTMIGIDLSRRIEEWIDEKEITSIIYTEEQLLDMITSFFVETNKIKMPSELFGSLCKLWISGKTFSEMFQELAPQINISSIENVCSKSISYNLSFLVGNIIDMLNIDIDDEDAVNPYFTLCALQKKIKYGVSSITSIAICDAIFNDRFLAEALSGFIGRDIKESDIIDLIKYNISEIDNTLTSFPEFFSDKIRMLIK